MGIATPETPAETPPVVEEPVAPASEAPSPEAPPEGAGEGTEAKGGEGFDPSALDADDWDYLLKNAPPEILEASEAVKGQRERDDQRERTRQQEEQTYRDTVAEGMTQLRQTGANAEAWVDWAANELERDTQLLDAFSDPENYDATRVRQIQQGLKEKLSPKTMREAIAAVKAATLVEAESTANMGRLRAIARLSSLGEHMDLTKSPLSKEEQQQVNEARYRDLQRGNPGDEGSMALFAVLMTRHGQSMLEKGKEMGVKDKQAQAALAEKMLNLKQARNGIAPKIDGMPPSSGPLTVEEAQTLPIEELKRRDPAL
jgi:hypothetical protein